MTGSSSTGIKPLRLQSAGIGVRLTRLEYEILNVGCGEGPLTAKMAAQVNLIVGIDASSDMNRAVLPDVARN